MNSSVLKYMMFLAGVGITDPIWISMISELNPFELADLAIRCGEALELEDIDKCRRYFELSLKIESIDPEEEAERLELDKLLDDKYAELKDTRPPIYNVIICMAMSFDSYLAEFGADKDSERSKDSWIIVIRSCYKLFKDHSDNESVKALLSDWRTLIQTRP